MDATISPALQAWCGNHEYHRLQRAWEFLLGKTGGGIKPGRGWGVHQGGCGSTLGLLGDGDPHTQRRAGAPQREEKARIQNWELTNTESTIWWAEGLGNVAIRARGGLLRASQKCTWLWCSWSAFPQPAPGSLREKVEIMAKHPQILPAFGRMELDVLPEVWKIISEWDG